MSHPSSFFFFNIVLNYFYFRILFKPSCTRDKLFLCTYMEILLCGNRLRKRMAKCLSPLKLRRQIPECLDSRKSPTTLAMLVKQAINLREMEIKLSPQINALTFLHGTQGLFFLQQHLHLQGRESRYMRCQQGQGVGTEKAPVIKRAGNFLILANISYPSSVLHWPKGFKNDASGCGFNRFLRDNISSHLFSLFRALSSTSTEFDGGAWTPRGCSDRFCEV